MRKITAILLIKLFFLLGVLIGILISPIKKGVGNNCGNTNNYYKHEFNPED